MKKITYQMRHRYTNELLPKTYVGYFENEDHFYAEMRLDGHDVDNIHIVAVEEATPEETAAHSGMAGYFATYGTENE